MVTYREIFILISVVLFIFGFILMGLVKDVGKLEHKHEIQTQSSALAERGIE